MSHFSSRVAYATRILPLPNVSHSRHSRISAWRYCSLAYASIIVCQPCLIFEAYIDTDCFREPPPPPEATLDSRDSVPGHYNTWRMKIWKQYASRLLFAFYSTIYFLSRLIRVWAVSLRLTWRRPLIL
jgi:hypothetical protein